jgi:hypothetical protein
MESYTYSCTCNPPSDRATLQATRYDSHQPAPISHTVVSKPTVMRPQDGPRTTAFKWSYSKSYQCRVPKCRNQPGLWIYSFRVVSHWDPNTNLYLPGTWSKFFHAHSQVTRHNGLDRPGIRFTLYYNNELNVCPGSFRLGPHYDCFNCNQIGHLDGDCPLPFNGLPRPNVAPVTPFAFWTRPPPQDYRPYVPPPPYQPLNTNYSAMVERYGGEIWHPETQTYLRPLTEGEVAPFVTPLSVSQVPRTVPPHALDPVQNVLIKNVHKKPSSSPRAPHGQIKVTTTTLPLRKSVK